jgi:hypothetical protein
VLQVAAEGGLRLPQPLHHHVSPVDGLDALAISSRSPATAGRFDGSGRSPCLK